MNKFFIVLLALASCQIDNDQLMFENFQKFITKYNKKYNSINEFLSRFEIFKKNVKEALSQNHETFKVGITKFSDLTQQEFSKTHLNRNYYNALEIENYEPVILQENLALPKSLDWRTYGRVSPVKNEGEECDSHWAFSVVGNLEGLYYARWKVMRRFSEQMLIDCDDEDGDCHGGRPQIAFVWLKNNGGIMFEDDYPYVGKKQKCKKDPSKYAADFKITGYQKLGTREEKFHCVGESLVQEFLYQKGPISVCLNCKYLYSYVCGMLFYSRKECPVSGIDHCVTLVGYGIDDTYKSDYWLLKNSWGKDWGENGYFRVIRGEGVCGINCEVTSATVEF